MSLIYILQEDGGHAPLEESEARDLLARQVLTPETQFWKEGMHEWRPLSELPSQGGAPFVPPRRTPDSVSSLASPVKTFPSVVARVQPVAANATPIRAPQSHTTSSPRRKSGRYRLRFNLVPLVACMQILYLGLIGATSYLIYLCSNNIFGKSVGSSSDPMAVLMGSGNALAGNQVGVSHDELMYLFYFFMGIVGTHAVSEILFFFWIYFTNKNCRGMASNIIYTPGWSVGYFFIPIVNWFRPYQVVQELWKVSMNPKGWMGRRDSIFVGFWFLVRLSSMILARGPFRTSYSDNDDPAIRAIGTLIYMTTAETIFLLVELTTMILVLIITWRQIRWSREAMA